MVGILHFTIDNNILDSINKSMNSNYVGFMNVELKKDSIQEDTSVNK